MRTSAIVAGPGQAVFASIGDGWTTMPAHDVSILITMGDARCLGSHPRANVSMMRIAEPQQGHGPGSTCGSFASAGAASVVSVATPSSARAVAMASARLPLARRP